MTANRFYSEWDLEYLPPASRPNQDHRTPFQVDRDRVLFSHAFRRLQSKTQVFQPGEYDFYRTRLTHTIEVARIARSIRDYLQATSGEFDDGFFIDPDLVEAVGLAHDLGHPPFGHIGERKLNELFGPFGGFEGNAQTLRIVTQLIYERPSGPNGMSPTRAFLDGLVKYKDLHGELRAAAAVRQDSGLPFNHFLYDEQADLRQWAAGPEVTRASVAGGRWARSIECQIMDWADDTAYSLHDIADGVRAGFLTIPAIEEWAAGQKLSAVENRLLENLLAAIKERYYEPHLSRRIGEYIRACRVVRRVPESLGKVLPDSHRYRYTLEIEPGAREECNLHKRMAVTLIFQSPPIQQIEAKGGFILGRLCQTLRENAVGGAQRPLQLLPDPHGRWVREVEGEWNKMRLLCDFLAGMTDIHALRLYRRLFEPDFGSLTDLA